MKQILIIVFLLFCKMLSAQDLIGTQTSLILVYNYPNNYFYIQLNGEDKRKTENENVFVIDKKLIQVKTLHRDKFFKNTNPDTTFIGFIKTYTNWEKSYLEESYSFNIKSKVEFLKSSKGKDIAFWTYDMPLQKHEQKTDSTITIPTQKQLFVLTRVKDYLVGINSPLFETQKFDTIKSYLINNINGIFESKNEIDVEALNKQLNKSVNQIVPKNFKDCKPDQMFLSAETEPKWNCDTISMVSFMNKFTEEKNLEKVQDGKIFVGIIIFSDGKICCSTFANLTKIELDADKFKDVVNKMPNWKPAKQNGKEITFLKQQIFVIKNGKFIEN